MSALAGITSVSVTLNQGSNATVTVGGGTNQVITNIENITATSGAVAGNASVSITGERLTHWRSAYFTPAEITAGLGADLADADADRLSNLLEYALGTDPRAASALPAATLDPTGHLTLTLTRPKSLPDVLYLGEATSDLTAWPTAVPIEILADGDPQTIRLTDPLGTSDSAQRFLRLRTTSP